MKDFVMDIVVKIKQYLLAAVILGNVQLIAMDLKNRDMLFEQQCELAQKQINELMSVCKARSAQEHVEALKEDKLVQKIKQRLEMDRKWVDWGYSQRNLMSQSECEEFSRQVVLQDQFYENLFNKRNENRLDLQARMADTKIVFTKLWESVEILKQKTEQYKLQQMSKKHQEANDKQLLLQQLANADEKRKQTNRKRKLAIDAANGQQTSASTKRRKISQSEFTIMPKKGVFGVKTSQRCVGEFDHLPVCNMFNNFSNIQNRIVGIAPKTVVRKK